MPLLNFQKQFAEKVRTGKKTQTIRATRKRPVVVGDIVILMRKNVYYVILTDVCASLKVKL